MSCSMPAWAAERSDFQAEHSGIAEVAVGEPIQKSKGGDAFKASGIGRNANHSDRGIKAHFRNLDLKDIEGVLPCIRSSQSNRCRSVSTTEQAITFLKDEIKVNRVASRARVRKEE